MRYFRVQFTQDGRVLLSDPLTTWVDAELFRRAIGGDAVVLAY